MAVDTEYLDELMKSIEPTIYPDGVPGEEESAGDELDSIPEKKTAADSEKEVASAIEAIDAQVQSDVAEEPGVEVVSEEEITDEQLSSGAVNAEGEVGWDEINVGDSAVGEEIELDMNMSEEEIEAMLNAAKSSADESVTQISDSEDVTDILSMFEGDSDISDIKDTLEKSDNNVAVDSSMLEQPEVVIPDIDAEEEPEAKEENGKKAKGKKKKNKSKDEEASEGKEKKKGGFFSKLFNALTEEVPEETEIPEKSETGVTDENAQILSELDSEDKGKKKKKKKKSKGKKEQPETQGDERDIREKSEDGDADSEGAKGKGKKDKKAKKEKKPKVKKVTEPEKPSKKLPRKRVRNTFILCLSILAAILVLTIFGTEFLTKKQARFAYDNAEYEEAYTGFYGEKLSDSDNEIYQKSRTIMLLQRKMSSYNNYMQLGMKAEALNALLEGYKIYPAVMEKAEEYGVVDQVKEAYNQLVSALSSFGLSTLDAEEINGYTSKVMYNKRILSIINGTPFEYDGVIDSSTDEVDESQDADRTLMDILPEEEDFLPDNPEDVFAQ